jgi:hypothetical protein
MEIDTLALEMKLSDLRRNFPLMLSFGAFAELRKATVNFVTLPGRPSVRMKEVGSHLTDFYKI